MAVWNSSVDSGVKPAVADYRRHAIEVRVGFDVRVRAMMKVGFRGYVNINRWG